MPQAPSCGGCFRRARYTRRQSGLVCYLVTVVPRLSGGGLGYSVSPAGAITSPQRRIRQRQSSDVPISTPG